MDLSVSAWPQGPTELQRSIPHRAFSLPLFVMTQRAARGSPRQQRKPGLSEIGKDVVETFSENQTFRKPSRLNDKDQQETPINGSEERGKPAFLFLGHAYGREQGERGHVTFCVYGLAHSRDQAKEAFQRTYPEAEINHIQVLKELNGLPLVNVTDHP